jgi:uncharacterized protein
MTSLKVKTTAFAILLLSASASQAQQLGIGTMGQGSSGYSMGAAIALVLSENGINALVQPSSGTSAYLPLIDMGELDLGIANAIEVGDAITGSGDFEGRALGNIAPAARLYPLRVGIFVQDDSEIQTIADLAGHSVTYGYTSQVTINSVVDAILAAGGIQSSDIEQTMVPNVLRGADAFLSGRADGVFFAIGSGKVTEVDASVGGVRFLPLPETDEAEERLQDIILQAYVEILEPREGLTGIDEPMPVMAYDYMLVVGNHVPDDKVARIVTILSDNKQALVDSFGAFQSMDPENMYVDIGVPYHPGALSVLDTND